MLSRGYHEHLGYSLLLLEQNALNCLPVIICTKVNIPFHSQPLKKETTVCLGICFLSYCCNLEESDSIYQISKTQEKVLSSEKSFTNVLALYSKYLCLSFHSGLFCNLISVPSTLLKLCLLKYPMTSICQIQGTTFRL